MCLGIPGKVVEIVDADNHLAKVDVSGVQRTISVRLLATSAEGGDGPGVAVDDWVLVHVGFALAKVDEDEAAMTLDQLKRLGRDYDDELESFASSSVV